MSKMKLLCDGFSVDYDYTCEGIYISAPEKSTNKSTEIVCKGNGCKLMTLESLNQDATIDLN